jgi:GntR family transcriptional regulator, phosphonate transport system regulatory protein
MMKASSDDAMTTANGTTTGVMLWRRIADDLERSIVHGDFVPGERLPGETEIAARFGVNRHTVRRALSELTERGLIRAERGSGTYVETSRLPYPIGPRTRFSEIVGAAGRQAGGRLIASAVETATSHISMHLRLGPNAPVIRLDILRSVDRVPVSIGTTWLPADLTPKAAKHYRMHRSMTKTLALAGITDYRRQSTRISAAMVDAVDAARLHLTAGRPLIVVDSVDETPDGRPVSMTHARFAADRVELVVER